MKASAATSPVKVTKHEENCQNEHGAPLGLRCKLLIKDVTSYICIRGDRIYYIGNTYNSRV